MSNTPPRQLLALPPCASHILPSETIVSIGISVQEACTCNAKYTGTLPQHATLLSQTFSNGLRIVCMASLVRHDVLPQRSPYTPII